MQYVGRAIGSVSKTWNSINPATLSGAIDVIVVEQNNGDLCCSPFHVRFGKFSLLRPSQKKVDFSVNGEKTDLPMKLGEGGEAFFVFETENRVPKDLQTSPVMSPISSPENSPGTPADSSASLQEPEFLDLSRSRSESPEPQCHRSMQDVYPKEEWNQSSPQLRSSSPGLSDEQTMERVRHITRRLIDVNIPSKITDNGDIVLDMTGYKSGDADFKKSEQEVRKILADEFGDDMENIGHDEEGNLRIFSREDSLGYASDDAPTPRHGTPSPPPPDSPGLDSQEEEHSYHAKTLRLTSDQLKSLNLKHGTNDITFSVNGGRAICSARMFYWKYHQPIVISDIDGTITKSDALGHVLTMIGRDWTHLGVGKLFSDIANNGYNIMYLTARSVGQADSTRYYLQGVEQNGYKLPDGPVILSPDRTMAALRREVIMRKPEVFKMACLRDIQSLFADRQDNTPFYAGFGNRITDALSYRSVGVPSSKIFTINSNSEVHMELLELAGYKSSYVHIADLVDHFFPPILESNKVEEPYTDVNFWRDPVADVSDLESLDDDDYYANNDSQEGEREGEEEATAAVAASSGSNTGGLIETADSIIRGRSPSKEKTSKKNGPEKSSSHESTKGNDSEDDYENREDFDDDDEYDEDYDDDYDDDGYDDYDDDGYDAESDGAELQPPLNKH